MSRVCQLTGKKPMFGNNVSHSMKKTKRRFDVNLVRKKFYIQEEDKWINLRISTSALRTISKLGVYQAIKKAKQAGTYTGE